MLVAALLPAAVAQGWTCTRPVALPARPEGAVSALSARGSTWVHTAASAGGVDVTLQALAPRPGPPTRVHIPTPAWEGFPVLSASGDRVALVSTPGPAFDAAWSGGVLVALDGRGAELARRTNADLGVGAFVTPQFAGDVLYVHGQEGVAQLDPSTLATVARASFEAIAGASDDALWSARAVVGLLGGAVAICGAAHGGATELIVWDLPAQRQVARAPTADACHLAPDGDGAHVTVNDPDGRATIYGADGAPRLRLPANAVAVGGGVAVTQQPIDGGIEYTFAPLDGGRPRVVRKQWSDAEPCVNGTPHPTSLTSGWIDSTTTLVYYTLTDASPPR